MEKLAEDLKNVLEQELKVHEELISTAQSITAAIKQKEVEKVHSLTDRYDSYIGKIEDLEEKRLAVCDALAGLCGKDTRHLTIINVISLVPENRRKALIDIKTALKEKIGILTKLNTMNQILLQEGLQRVAMHFQLLAKSQTSLGGYKQGGQIDSRPVRQNIVNKTA